MEITKIHTDGGSRGNPGPGASAFVAYGKNGEILYSEGKYLGATTNNIAEYTGVILAIDWLVKKDLSDSPIKFYLDSQLVVNQLNGIFKIRDNTLRDLAIKIKEKEKSLPFKISYHHIFRNENKDADLLVNQTLDAS